MEALADTVFAFLPLYFASAGTLATIFVLLSELASTSVRSEEKL